MVGETTIEEPMDVEVLPVTGGINAKNKEKDSKSALLPWYVTINNSINLRIVRL